MIATVVSRLAGRRWKLVLVAVAVVIFVTAVIPTGDGVARPGPLGIVTLDLWLHAIAYFSLELAALRAFADSVDFPLGTTSLLVVAYGVLIEGVQFWVPYRRASGADALANTVGVALAVVCWLLADRLR